MSISLLITDDHHMVRQGVRALLESQPGFEVVGEASTGREAVDLARLMQPNVLVLDWMMPGLNGMEVTRLVGEASPKTRVLILSMYSNEAYVSEALRAGALGYVLKGSPINELVKAIQTIMKGRRYLSPPLSERSIEAYLQKSKDTSLDTYEILTTREREILQMVAEGYTNVEIADELKISPRTVETHRANLMRKLNIRSQAELVRYALRRGLVPIEE
jgi:DNA-binding NarL/FixJ family response regulator